MRKTHQRVYLALGALLAGAAVNLTPPATGPASAAIPNAVIAVGDSHFDSEPEKSAEAACPDGTHVIGGGFSVDSDHVFIIQMEPISDENGDRILVTAHEDETGTPNDWAVHAEANCTDAENVPGYHIASRQATVPPGSRFVNINSFCDNQATALGAGMRTINATNQVHFTTSMPIFGASTSMAAGWEDPTGFDQEWQLVSYTICADIPGSDVTVVEVDSAPGSESPLRIEASCPAGTRAIGGSGFANQFASISLLQLAPGRSGVVLEGAEVVPTDAEWDLEVRAVCV